MKTRISEHVLSLVFVSLVLVAAMAFLSAQSRSVENKKNAGVKEYAGLTFANFNDPFERTLFKDVMNSYYPGQYDQNTILIESILTYQRNEFTQQLQQSFLKEELSARKITQLLGMFFKFLVVYGVVLALVHYSVQTMAVWRFVRRKQETLGLSSSPNRVVAVLKKCGKTIGVFILFMPAYVIAYSIRTEFNTDTIFFMTLLALISNGLLITYANKFYTFLAAESRKGYVDTAVVKGLFNSYESHTRDGISLQAILRPAKRFKGHVFDHIFKNARYQYLATIKEQASFLISSLIIIEMALNIHGHLSYELLRQLLYKNYDIVIAIVLLIFVTVKATELCVDAMMSRQAKKYENR